MKITVRNKEPEIKKMLIKDVPVGYVFKILDGKYGNEGVTVLKLHRSKFVLLQYSYGDDWFEIGDSCWNDYPIKILGKLTEIIVEE